MNTIAPAAAGTGSAVPSSLGEGTWTGSGAGTVHKYAEPREVPE